MKLIPAALALIAAITVLWFALFTDRSDPVLREEHEKVSSSLPAADAVKACSDQTERPPDPAPLPPETDSREDQKTPPREKIDPGDCAEIAGVVINGNTYLPFEAELARKATVELRRILPDERTETCRLDRTASFRFTKLSAGTFSLEVKSRDFPDTSVRDIVVRKGEIINDLRIVVPPFGKLSHPYYTGLDYNGYQMTLTREGESKPYFSKHCRYVPNIGSYGFSSNKVVIPLPAGRWTARFTSEEIGQAVRRFEILPQVLLELQLEKSDFMHQPGCVTVEGRLLLPDGSPFQGYATLEITGTQTAEWGSFDRKIKLTTGFHEPGSFTTDYLTPGNWKVTVWILPDYPNKRSRRLHTFELTIPQSPPDPFPCDLVLTSGKVTGTLIDARSKIPIPGAPIMRIRLEDKWKGEIAVEALKACTAPSFELENVPPGDYRLVIQAVPYENLTDICFSLGQGERLDLGNILLQPAGVIVVNVRGAGGRSLRGLGHGFPDRTELTCPQRYSIKGRSGLIFSIPSPGAVRMIVSSGGFKNKTVTFEVPSGIVQEFDVVLEPE